MADRDEPTSAEEFERAAEQEAPDEGVAPPDDLHGLTPDDPTAVPPDGDDRKAHGAGS